MSGIQFTKKQLLERSGFAVEFEGKDLGVVLFESEKQNWAYYPWSGYGAPLFACKDFVALKAEIQACWLDGCLETQWPAVEASQSLGVKA